MAAPEMIGALLADSSEQADTAVDLLRLSWLLLGLTAMGVFGVIMLAVFRRAYLRSRGGSRSVRDEPGEAPVADPWSESARRLRVEPSPPDAGQAPGAEP